MFVGATKSTSAPGLTAVVGVRPLQLALGGARSGQRVGDAVGFGEPECHVGAGLVSAPRRRPTVRRSVARPKQTMWASRYSVNLVRSAAGLAGSAHPR